ncbi:pentapeptide repeat-containing protein [Myxosarcina sp. GI1(2024)]
MGIANISETLSPELAKLTESELYRRYKTEVLIPASLRDANLEGANLKGANLRKVYLNNANLTNADLTNADLRKADFRGANLTGANLTGANLSEANLSQANLTSATLVNTNRYQTIFCWTIMPDGDIEINPALDLITEKLNPVKRKAYLPITVREDRGSNASKFAGKPWLNKNESYPVCSCCNNPLCFFLQLNLDEFPKNLNGEFGSGILQLFYCTN